MELIDSSAISRGMIRVDPGEDFVESLKALAQAAGWTDAFVTGAGVLELVELAGSDGTVTLEGAEVLTLSGRIARHGAEPGVMLFASVLARGSVHSGRVVAAMTGALLLVVDAVGQTDARRPAPPPAASGAAPAPRVAPPPTEDAPRSATKPLSQSFTTRPVLRNVPSPPPDDEDYSMEVEAGDFIDHPQLGLCEVVGDDGSGGTRIRMSSGRVRVLRLDALRVLPSNEDDEGRRVYKVAGPRPRR